MIEELMKCSEDIQRQVHHADSLGDLDSGETPKTFEEYMQNYLKSKHSTDRRTMLVRHNGGKAQRYICGYVLHGNVITFNGFVDESVSEQDGKKMDDELFKCLEKYFSGSNFV